MPSQVKPRETDQRIKLSELEKWFLAIAVGMAVLRFVLSSKLGLGDDEAYYWDWSRRLQLSYYDHPGMTAWLIKLGTLLFGQNSFAVRFFGLIANTVSGVLLWFLGVRLFNRTVALIGVFFYLFAPIYSMGGMLMVPDAPMGVAWLALLLITWRLLGERGGDDRWALWLLAGAVLGLGLLSKYTIVLLAFSIVLFMVSEADLRKKLLGSRFWCTVLVTVVLCLPIIIWNSELGWPTVKYHLHDRQTGGGGANFNRWGQFWASQTLILSPALFAACLAVWGVALKRFRERKWRFIFLTSFPTFAIFCTQALFAEFKPHWPAPAYSLLFLGVAALLENGFGIHSAKLRRFAVSSFVFLVLIIFVPMNLLFYIGSVVPLIPKLARIVMPHLQPQFEWDPKFDPTNDLYGWDEAAKRIHTIQDDFRQRGESAPFVSSSRYQLTAQLAFALQERVWRVSPDKDQYGFWQTVESQKPLLGKNAIYVTDNRFERNPNSDYIFKNCDEQDSVFVYRGTEPARRFHIWLCRDFLGTR